MILKFELEYYQLKEVKKPKFESIWLRVQETAFFAIFDMHIFGVNYHFFGLKLIFSESSELNLSIYNEIFPKT